jgi:hypothetical protein
MMLMLVLVLVILFGTSSDVSALFGENADDVGSDFVTFTFCFDAVWFLNLDPPHSVKMDPKLP